MYKHDCVHFFQFVCLLFFCLLIFSAVFPSGSHSSSGSPLGIGAMVSIILASIVTMIIAAGLVKVLYKRKKKSTAGYQRLQPVLWAESAPFFLDHNIPVKRTCLSLIFKTCIPKEEARFYDFPSLRSWWQLWQWHLVAIGVCWLAGWLGQLLSLYHVFKPPVILLCLSRTDVFGSLCASRFSSATSELLLNLLVCASSFSPVLSPLPFFPRASVSILLADVSSPLSVANRSVSFQHLCIKWPIALYRFNNFKQLQSQWQTMPTYCFFIISTLYSRDVRSKFVLLKSGKLRIAGVYAEKIIAKTQDSGTNNTRSSVLGQWVVEKWHW